MHVCLFVYNVYVYVYVYVYVSVYVSVSVFVSVSVSIYVISPWLLQLGVCSCRVHPCAPGAHLAVMVNPRTHCHFMMQARALQVPELCDDHTLHHSWLPTHLPSQGTGL